MRTGRDTRANRWPLVLRLGSAQTLAWASSYYLPAILAPAMAREFGLPVSQVWLLFSMALVVSALLGPLAGRRIDRVGGRPVLVATSLLFAAGLLGLAGAQGALSLALAWLLLGVAMGGGLYEAAFATLVRLQGSAARPAITGITLIAGLASTVGWPLTSLLEAELGWRGACAVWAGLHLIVGLPLNAWLPRAAPWPSVASQRDRDVHEGPAAAGSTTDRTSPAAAAQAAAEALQAPASPVAAPTRAVAAPPPRHTAALLAFVFAVVWFTSTAMAAHLPQLLMDSGLSAASAVAVGALVGPAQVAGRLLEFGWLQRWHPLLSARLATLTHPAGAALWLWAGPVMAPAFALLHGAGNGILTISKGTLPLVFFGPVGYGLRQGLLTAPGRLAQAFAPWLFGLCLHSWGHRALWLTTGLTLLAGAALMLLRAHDARTEQPG